MHNAQVFQVLQTHQKCSQNLDPVLEADVFMLPEIVFQRGPLQILHRQVQRILGLIHSKQLDNVLAVHPPHNLYLVLDGHLPFSFEGDLFHECLDCHLSVFSEVLSQVDAGEVALSYFPNRLEEFVEMLASDAR